MILFLIKRGEKMYCLEPKDYGKIHNILEESFKTPTFAFAIANHIIQGSIYIHK